MFVACLANRPISVVIERYNKTGKLTKGKPSVINLEDPVADFVDKMSKPLN